MRLVIFDMDGTLIDSVALIVETVNATFDEVGVPRPGVPAIRAISGLSVPIAFQQMAPDADEPTRKRLADAYYRQYAARAGQAREPMFMGAMAALDRLRGRPDTILAVATGKGYRGAVALLDAHGILAHFDSVQTPDHNHSKPDPQMILTAMSKAGALPSRTAMIGDTRHDMAMARAAGVAAIGVAWGYHPEVDLRAAGADIVIDRFDELDAALDQLLGP